MISLLVLITLLQLTFGYQDNIQIGIILRDDIEEQIIENVFWRMLSNGPQNIPFQAFKEKVWIQDAIHYHRAVCSLMDKGVGVILAPTAGAYVPILSSFSNEYNISLISPEIVETPDDPKAPDLTPKFAVGIRPSTTRAILDLLRHFRWQEIVYIYDDDYGAEKLQVMFRVGYTTLKLKVVGFAKVGTAKEANDIIRGIVSRGRHTNLHVILDTDIDLAQEILQLHVHYTGVRDKNYHFLLTQPTLINFWTSLEFRAIKITGFLAFVPESNRFNEKEEWTKLLGHRTPAEDQELAVSDYYYHDAALLLSQAVSELWRSSRTQYDHLGKSNKILNPKDCFEEAPDARLAQFLKKINVDDGLTGKLQFSELTGRRKNINLTIVQTTHVGYKEFGSWTDFGKNGGIRIISPSRKHHYDGTLPQVQDKRTLRVVTIISAPYMMLKKHENGSELVGNARFEGYCKDILDEICKIMEYDYELTIVPDGSYGKFDSSTQRWSGMIGEIIKVKADMAVGDLIVSGKRQRVVDFTDPFEMVSFSLLMKNPNSVRVVSSMFFVFSAFAPDVWICIIVSAILFILLFHGITKLTGAPDSIESSSVIWGRKITIIMNVWFAIGSSMMQGTGVHPRSIASRILSGTWWFSTSIFTCLFIASITAQLRINETGENSPQLLQLKSLSLESIILESLTRGWPTVGIIADGSTERFIRKSSLPLYRRYAEFLNENPQVKVVNREEGAKRVRDSDGSYILVMESASSDFATRLKPCDLVAIHDTNKYAGYGFALSPLLEPTLISNISSALSIMQADGMLGHLHRKWWIDYSQCKEGFVDEISHGTLHSFSGLLCILLVGFLILMIAFGIQYSRKIHDRESRRQQLTFDDLNLDHRLPTPPPELLAQPPPVLDVPEIERATVSGRSGSESFKDFFDRMRGGT